MNHVTTGHSSSAVVAIMSLEAALSLSIPELLQVLNKKLVLECTRVQEIRIPSGAASVTTLEAEVSHDESISSDYLSKNGNV